QEFHNLLLGNCIALSLFYSEGLCWFFHFAKSTIVKKKQKISLGVWEKVGCWATNFFCFFFSCFRNTGVDWKIPSGTQSTCCFLIGILCLTLSDQLGVRFSKRRKSLSTTKKKWKKMPSTSPTSYRKTSSHKDLNNVCHSSS